MSDVSGIPNMGFGGGNFFAPQFSYNPQMSAAQASAAYMPAVNYNQNVVNNTFASGGGFGRQTDYYSALGANYLAQVPMSWENPYAGGGVPASLAYPGASLSGGYTTGAANMPSFDTGPGPFGFTSGGAGALDLSRMGNGLFSGGLGSGGGGYSGPSIDWNGVGSAAANLKQDPYPGMSMPGGLGTPLGASSGAQPFDWSTLFGGGGARAEPAPSVSTPAPQASGASNAPAPQSAAPSVPAAMPSSQRLLGYEPGVLPTLPGKSQDQPAFDFSGGNAGWGNAPSTAMPSSKALLGYEPQNTPSTAIDWKLFQSPANDYSTFQGGGRSQGPQADAGAGGALTSGGGLTAAELGEQARARLAQLMAPEAKAEIPAPATPPVMASDEKIPLPVARPAEADAADPYAALPGAIPLPAERPAEAPARPDPNAPRPPENVPEFPAKRMAPNGQEPELFVVHHTGDNHSPEAVVADWRDGPRKADRIGSQYIMDRNGVVHDTLNEYGYSGTNHAKDLEMPGTGISKSQQGTSNKSIVGMEIIANDERDVTPAQRAALVQFAQERYPNTPFYGHGEISTNRANNEGVPGAQAVLDARIAAGQGWPSANFVWPDRAAPAAPAPAASRAADTGLSQLNLPPEFPEHTALYPNYANRYGSSAPPQFGATGAAPGGELPSPGAFTPFEGFRQSPDFENRSTEQLSRDQLAELQTRGTSYEPGPEVASTPLGTALGLEDLQRTSGAANVVGPSSSAFDLSPGGFGEGGYGNAFAPGVNPQQGPTMPSWQASIPPAYRTPEVTAAIQALSDRFGIPPEAAPAVAGVEGSGWNPKYMTGTQAGIFQMAPDDFKTAGGKLGGLTYDQYRNASPAQQVAAYSDYIAQSPNAAYLKGVGDPALAAAILQGIQLRPMKDDWSERLLIGDTGSPVTTKPQASELGNTSIDFMRDAMARRIAGFPQTQSLPGGR